MLSKANQRDRWKALTRRTMMSDLMPPLRPATQSDVPAVRALLAEAIADSPYYGDLFKAHETARFNTAMLRTLIDIDPWHIALAVRGGTIVAICVTMPEFGNIWTPWAYVVPEYREKALGLTMLRYMIRHYDHGRFHKASCLVRPENRGAATIFRRLGFRQIALLQNHMFGEDYILMELPLTKAVAGYDEGVSVSRLGLLSLRLKNALGLSKRY